MGSGLSLLLRLHLWPCFFPWHQQLSHLDFPSSKPPAYFHPLGAFALALPSPRRTPPWTIALISPSLLFCGDFASQRTSGKCLETYLIVTAEEGATGDARDAAKHPILPRTAPMTRSDPVPNASSTEDEKPCPTQFSAQLFFCFLFLFFLKENFWHTL